MRKPWRRRVRSLVLARWLPASLLVATAGCTAPVIGGIANPGPAHLPPPPIAPELRLVPVATPRPARPQVPTEDVAALYREARLDLNAGRTQEAIARLRHVRALDPSQLEAANVLAVLLAESGDIDGARAELRAVLSMRPTDPVARNNAAVLGNAEAPPKVATAMPPTLPAGAGASGGMPADPTAAAGPTNAGPTNAGPTTGAATNTRLATAVTAIAASSSATTAAALADGSAKAPAADAANASPSRPADGLTRIELHNASRHAGLAVRVSKRLTPDGASARTLRTGNWARFNLLRTEIHHRPGAGTEAARIARLLGLPPSALRATPNVPDDVDLRIILGHDAGRAGDAPRPPLSARSART